MKTLKIRNLALFLTAAFSLKAMAQIPAELLALIPTGSSMIKLQGKDPQGEPCTVVISSERPTFNARAYLNKALDQDGVVRDLKHYAKFQIGLGHELKKFTQSDEKLEALSYHKAEEEYSSDTRSTLQVEFDEDSVMESITILQESRRLVGWTKTKVVCNF